MNARVWFRCDPRPFERIPGDLAVAGLAASSGALRSALGRADWRLCGQVSELVQGEAEAANLGAATLVATQGRLAAPRLLVVGLGAAEDFGAPRLAEVLQQIFRKTLELGAARIVLAPLGFPDDDFPRHVELIVEAALAATQEVELDGPFAIQLPVPADEISRVERALDPLCRIGGVALAKVAAQVSAPGSPSRRPLGSVPSPGA